VQTWASYLVLRQDCWSEGAWKSPFLLSRLLDYDQKFESLEFLEKKIVLIFIQFLKSLFFIFIHFSVFLKDFVWILV